MKDVLVISKGLVHPDVLCRYRLRRILRDSDDSINYRFSSDLDKLDGIDSCGWQAVVLFLHEKKISDGQLNSMARYVEGGGRLICIHGALASFKQYEMYTGLTGSQFAGHGKVDNIEITGEKCFSIRDELYKFVIAEDCEVRMKSGDTPVYWIRRQGKGLVYCLSPGHRLPTFYNRGYIGTVNGIIKECMESGDTDEKS